MSNIICFLAFKNLFRGKNVIGDFEYFIANWNVRVQTAFSVFLCLVLTVVKFFLIFKNKKVEYAYNIAVEMFQNERAIRTYIRFGFVNNVLEIVTCYYIKRVFETSYKLNFARVVGFLTVPIFLRTVIFHALTPTPTQLMSSIHNAEIEVKNYKEKRRGRTLLLLVVNKLTKRTKNEIKRLPFELIQMIGEIL
jgi:hypothetical protein